LSEAEAAKPAIRAYFRRDQRDGVGPPDLSKVCTYAEHIVHARGKRTQFTSVSLNEIDEEPKFDTRSILVGEGDDPAASAQEALWDVVFTRLSGLQEYGYHAGLESVMWATDSLNGGLSTLNWPALKNELSQMRQVWTEQILSHATEQGVFFPQADDEKVTEPDVDQA
jgi:hypothetical protein